MLNEYQTELLPERIYQRLNAINTEYLESIGQTLKKIGELRPSDVHKLQQMYEYGTNADDIARKLAKASEKNISEIYEIFDIVAKENYDYSKPFYKAKGMPFIPYEENESLQRYVKALAKQTADEYINLTQHTAFAVFSKDGKSIAPLFESNANKVATSLSDTYTKVIDYAVSKVQTGVSDYNSAIRNVVKAISDSGIRTVDYATGYSRRLDSAVRQNILWGLKQCNQNTADLIGKEFGADGYEIDYHSAPRPSHADMGGRQYAIGKGRTINGEYYPSFESEAEPLLNDYGCLHFKFSILLGISEPTYSPETLATLKANDNEKVEFEGKKYTKYEASQVQRKLETEIRRQKDRTIIAKAAGDREMREEAQAKINLLTSKYAKFSKAAGLPTKMERARVAGFRNISVKSVDKTAESGIIKMNRQTKNIGVFAELQEHMSKKHIRSVATECGIDLKGLTLNIDKNEDLLRTFLAGRADYENIGQITFFPNAFKTKDELIRTIYHEKIHVEQYKKYGVKFVQNNSGRFEEEAYNKEEEFIKSLKERGVL